MTGTVGAGELSVTVAAAVARNLELVLTALGFVDDELTADSLTGLPMLGSVAGSEKLRTGLLSNGLISNNSASSSSVWR